MDKENADFSPACWNDRGLRLELSGNYEEALKCYKAAIQQDSKYPPSTEAVENKTRLLGRMGKWEESLKSGAETMKLGDRYYDADEILKTLESEGEGSAKKKILKMLEDNGKNFSAVYLMGYILSREEKYEEALTYFIRAAEIDPKNEYPWHDAGLTYLDLKKPDEAIKCLEKATRLNPFKAQAWNDKGAAYYETGRKDEALKCYEKALELDPEHPLALQNKCEVLYDMGKVEESFKGGRT